MIELMLGGREAVVTYISCAEQGIHKAASLKLISH